MQRNASLLSLLTLATFAAVPVQAQWSTTSLSTPRTGLVALEVSGLALFAGGREGQMMPSALVDVFDSGTNSWSQTALSVARGGDFAGTVVGQFALFAGGAVSPTASTAVVDVYDALTGTWSTATLSQARYALAATTVGDKAFFAGGGLGGPNNNTGVSDVVDVYDASIGPPNDPAAWSVATPLSAARGGLAAAGVGSQALFAGGLDPSSAHATVDIYDASIGGPDNQAAWSVAMLSEARVLTVTASATAGTRAYFAGGQTAQLAMSDVVDVYDALTGTWSDETLSQARGRVAATALGNTVLFAGGIQGSLAPSDVVDLLNAGTGTWSPTAQLGQARGEMDATTVGGRAMFAGGTVGNGQSSALVDVYEPVGVNYCAALANSSGCAATISATGSTSIALNDLALRAVCVPNQPFLFFHAATQTELPFGDGLRCAGGDLVRLPVGLAAGNVAETSVDLPSANITGPGARYFQCWFRDPAAGGSGFNTSDALAITFVP